VAELIFSPRERRLARAAGFNTFRHCELLQPAQRIGYCVL
jgi:hypothetical protein